MMTRGSTSVSLLLLLFALGACQRPSETASDTRRAAAPAAGSSGVAEVGAAMPAYTAKALDGGTYDLSQQRGKVILLNIWATWCPPCRHEIPELVKLQNTYASEGFEVVGVSVDSEDMEDEIAPFIREYEINYPVVLDPDGVIADLFETNVLPTSALIDRDGNVVWSHVGAVEADDERLLSALRAAL